MNIVVAGQSNSVGINYGIEAVKDYLWYVENGMNSNIINNNIPAKEPFTHIKGSPYKTGNSFTSTFAYLLNKHLKIKINIIDCGASGSVISEEPHSFGSWHPNYKGTGGCHLNNLKQKISSSPPSILLWHQGESDSIEPRSSKYESNMRTLLTEFTKILPTDAIIIAGTIHGQDGPYHRGTDFLPKQIRAFQNLCKEFKNFFYIRTDCLANPDFETIKDGSILGCVQTNLEPMNVHYSGKCHRKIGALYFQEWFRIKNKIVLDIGRLLSEVSYDEIEHITGNNPLNLNSFVGTWWAVGRKQLLRDKITITLKNGTLTASTNGSDVFSWTFATSTDGILWKYNNGLTLQAVTVNKEIYFPIYDTSWFRNWWEGEWKAPGIKNVEGRIIIRNNKIYPKNGFFSNYSWTSANIDIAKGTVTTTVSFPFVFNQNSQEMLIDGKYKYYRA